MKKFKNDDGSHSVVLGTAIIIIVMIIVFGTAFAFMYSKDMLFLPDFIERILGLDKREDPITDMGALSEIVKAGKDELPEGIILDVSYESIKAAFLTERQAESLYIKARTGYYSEAGLSWRNLNFYRDGERFRAELFADDKSDTPEIIKISDGEKIKFISVLENESIISPKAEDISAENEAGIPTVDDLMAAVEFFPDNMPESGDDSTPLETLPTFNTEIGTNPSSAVEDCSFMLIHLGEDNVYFIAYTNKDSGIREEYYVLPEKRIIVFYTVKNSDGKPIYIYEVTELSLESEDCKADALYDMS